MNQTWVSLTREHIAIFKFVCPANAINNSTNDKYSNLESRSVKNLLNVAPMFGKENLLSDSWHSS